jgi:osmotically-inducible protein OsmY
MTVQRFPILAATVVLATSLGLTACNREEEKRTVGQKIDSTIAKVEKQADQAASEVRKGVDAARTSTGEAIDAVGNKVKDAAITTAVNAELARDGSLSALKIDVDTSNGRVFLRGTAPDEEARKRATQLTLRVDGVVSVLQVRS